MKHKKNSSRKFLHIDIDENRNLIIDVSLYPDFGTGAAGYALASSVFYIAEVLNKSDGFDKERIRQEVFAHIKEASKFLGGKNN